MGIHRFLFLLRSHYVFRLISIQIICKKGLQETTLNCNSTAKSTSRRNTPKNRFLFIFRLYILKPYKLFSIKKNENRDSHTVEKKISSINEIGGRGWPTAYVVDWTLYIIEWIILQLENKDTTTKCIHSIKNNVKLTPYAADHARPSICLIQKNFFSVYCFLTDFTKCLLWRSVLLDFYFLTEEASWVHRTFKKIKKFKLVYILNTWTDSH